MPTRKRTVVHRFCAALFVLMTFSCGDDDSPTGSGREALATTPQEFVDVFETAYVEWDIETYTALLHEDFTYHFLPEDPKNALASDTWGRFEDSLSTANMFSHAATYDSIKLRDITVDIELLNSQSDTVSVPGENSDVIFHHLLTEVGMVVVVDDPDASDGTGIVNLVVFSFQEFSLRTDKTLPDNLLLIEQEDREPISKKPASGYATEETSWGAVKKLFRYARDPVTEDRIRRLLEDDFGDAWVRQDSVAYAAVLDSDYQFENLLADPEDTLAETWNRTEEMRIAGHMFSGWINAHNQHVQSISLGQRIYDIDPHLGSFAGKPSDEDWFDATTEVTLVVVVKDASMGEGMGITNYSLEGRQDYVVRPDPADETAWLVRLQKDIDPNLHKREVSEEPSWGAIKQLFR